MDQPDSPTEDVISRREFVETALVTGVVAGMGVANPASAADLHDAAQIVSCTLKINGQQHQLQIDTRTTLLDALRENLHLTGTKKGCDHGQCGACTVLVNGRRVNSCLSLALTLDGDQVTTIEGLAKGHELHPVQSAFLEYDGFQCGYCTPGQICSAVALLEEARRGSPSAVTADLRKTGPANLTDDEIRERMSGNVCRCGAYPNIVAAVRAVAQGRRA